MKHRNWITLGCLALLATMRSASASPVAGQGFLYGDVNGDGRVTTSDAVLALREAVDLDPVNLRADIAPDQSDGTVGDGQVTVADALRILQMALGLEPLRRASLTLIADSNTPTAIVDNSFPLHLEATNTGTKPLRLEYTSGPQVDFVVMKNGSEVWRWSHHQALAQTSGGGVSSLVLQPGVAKDWTASWNGRDDTGNSVPPGDYTFLGELPTANGGTLVSELSPLHVGGTGTGGLVVTLTTDHSSYAPGQPVRMTLTETNTGTQDVSIIIGCPTFYDFWVTIGSQEVWRWSHGKLICLAIGIGKLHPGESRQLSAVWNGDFNEGTALPLPSTYQAEIHGQTREPNGTFTPPPVPVTIGPMPVDYFPLSVSSVWTYEHATFGSTNITSVKQTITGTQSQAGNTYYVFDHYVDADNALLREDANGVVWQRTPTTETIRYKLNAQPGEHWTFNPTETGRAFTATMVSRSAELDTPYGHLSNLLEIAFLTGVDTSETDYLAPGVGLVGVNNLVNVRTTPTLRLADYTPGPPPAVAFPLKVGDAWTYVNTDPRLVGPAAEPLATQAITGTDTANGQTYYVFDHYAFDGGVELREDANSVVWQRTPVGETERYLLNAAVGDTWTYSPQGNNGAAWHATMVSRNATLSTPYGPLTGLLEIRFMGVDVSHVEYVDPGIGFVGNDFDMAPRAPVPQLRLKSYTPAP